MSNLNLEDFNETDVIKKLKKSNSNEIKRGRKQKYQTEEERHEARKNQQKAYRERKKKEIEELKEKVKNLENIPVAQQT